MKFAILALVGSASQLVAATPMDADASIEIRMEDSAPLQSRQTASGCWHAASPRCCVPGICMCPGNSGIFYVNQDNINRGLHGCDPPWGYIGPGYSSYPGYCCREAEDGSLVEIATSKVVE